MSGNISTNSGPGNNMVVPSITGMMNNPIGITTGNGSGFNGKRGNGYQPYEREERYMGSTADKNMSGRGNGRERYNARGGLNLTGRRPRCRDYDEKGYCFRGELCPYDHGHNIVIVDNMTDLIAPNQKGNSEGYNPDNPLFSANIPLKTSSIPNNMSSPPYTLTPPDFPPPGCTLSAKSVTVPLKSSPSPAPKEQIENFLKNNVISSKEEFTKICEERFGLDSKESWNMYCKKYKPKDRNILSNKKRKRENIKIRKQKHAKSTYVVKTNINKSQISSLEINLPKGNIKNLKTDKIKLNNSCTKIDSSENKEFREACSEALEIILIDKDNGSPSLSEEIPAGVLICIYYGIVQPEYANSTSIQQLMKDKSIFQFCAGSGKEMADSLLAIHTLEILNITEHYKPPIIIVSEDRGFKHLLDTIRTKNRIAVQLNGKKGLSMRELLFEGRIRYPEHKKQLSNSDIKHWNVNQVCEWLENFKDFLQYVEIFKENEITGEDLLELNEENLDKNLNIKKLGHRKRIIREIRILQGE